MDGKLQRTGQDEAEEVVHDRDQVIVAPAGPPVEQIPTASEEMAASDGDGSFPVWRTSDSLRC